MFTNPTPPGTPRRQKPIDKAAEIIIEGRVELTDTRVYMVQGDHGNYEVAARVDGVSCPCEARTPLCSHVLAVMITEQHRRATADAIDGGLAA